MSEPISAPDADTTPPTLPLQFDQAEYAASLSPLTCTACRGAIEQDYYQLNDQPVCRVCRVRAMESPNRGSRATRFSRAAGAGTLAGIAGALLYFAIAKATGYEIGLIAVVVGFAVGGAVRWGCYGRGGSLYQALAMVLTYLAIVGTYVPDIITGIQSADTATGTAAADAVTPAPAVATAEPVAAPGEAPASLGRFVLALVFVLAIAAAAPFLGGVSNIIGILIIGFGVYEAWKLNKRPVMIITGPHAIAAATAVPSLPAAAIATP